MTETLLRTQISQFTGCPKFIPLISCTITFEHNFISTSVKNSKRCLLLYRVLVFRSSETGMPPLFRCLFLCFCFCFFFLSRSIKTLRHGVRISHAAPVEAQMIHFDHFYHLSGTQEPFRPQTISCIRLGS